MDNGTVKPTAAADLENLATAVSLALEKDCDALRKLHVVLAQREQGSSMAGLVRLLVKR